jgi:hypothetical protein
MADESDDIRQEIKKGRQDIANTRSAMAKKLAMLDHRVEEAVEGVKDTFDLRSQVKQRPWVIMGGALLVGYVLGRQGNVPDITADPPGAPSTCALPQQTIGSAVKSQVKNELATKGQAFFRAVASTLWAMTKHLLEPKRQVEGNSAQSINRP